MATLPDPWASTFRMFDETERRAADRGAVHALRVTRHISAVAIMLSDGEDPDPLILAGSIDGRCNEADGWKMSPPIRRALRALAEYLRAIVAGNEAMARALRAVAASALDE